MLHFAASHGKLDVIKILLDHNGINDINLTDRDCRTALYHACANGHVESAQYLLEVSSDDWFGSHYQKMLTLAWKNGHSVVFKIFFQAMEGFHVRHENSCFLQGDQRGHSLLFKVMTQHWPGVIKTILEQEKEW